MVDVRRIRPIFVSSDTRTPMFLYSFDEVELLEPTLGAGLNAFGTLEIYQLWAPLRFGFVFHSGYVEHESGRIVAPTLAHPFTLDEIDTGVTFEVCGRHFSGEIGFNYITQDCDFSGELCKFELEIEESRDITSVVFHLINYPGIRGGKYSQDSNRRDKFSEVRFESNGWRIRIQPVAGAKDKEFHALNLHQDTVNGIAELTKLELTPISTSEVKHMVDAVECFLSIVFLDGISAILLTGLDPDGVRSWFYTQNKLKNSLRLQSRHRKLIPAFSDHLNDCFRCFLRNWDKANQRATLASCVQWLVDSQLQIEKNIHHAIAVAQVPLEMLVESVITTEQLASHKSAANKINLVLEHLEIPTELPSTLHEFAEANEIGNGPELITRVRNKIIHPNARSQDFIKQNTIPFCDSQFSRFDPLLSTTMQLFLRYIGLIILKSIGYNGEYLDPVNSQISRVPWASQNDDPT